MRTFTVDTICLIAIDERRGRRARQADEPYGDRTYLVMAGLVLALLPAALKRRIEA